MDKFSNYVPNVHFEKIPIRNLVSNQDYQRNLSQAHIARAAANFDLYQINPVKVSRRDGVNYVFNGQHTIEIVALVSGSRDTPVWCMIYDDLCYEHEADIFATRREDLLPLFLAGSVPGISWLLSAHLLEKDSFYGNSLRFSPESHPRSIHLRRVCEI